MLKKHCVILLRERKGSKMNRLAKKLLECDGIEEETGLSFGQLNKVFSEAGRREKTILNLSWMIATSYAGALACGIFALFLAKFFVISASDTLLGFYDPFSGPALYFKICVVLLFLFLMIGIGSTYQRLRK
jgi:hypothetical protein